MSTNARRRVGWRVRGRVRRTSHRATGRGVGGAGRRPAGRHPLMETSADTDEGGPRCPRAAAPDGSTVSGPPRQRRSTSECRYISGRNVSGPQRKRVTTSAGRKCQRAATSAVATTAWRNVNVLRWKGPYTIKGKVGITDYRIQVGNQLRLFHVNMLRKYTEREPIECAMAAVIDIVDCPELVIEAEPSADGETIQDIDVSREIEEPHANALRQLLSEYSDIFSDMPGLTDIAEHGITLTTEKPIRRKPYPVPYAKVGDIETEVRKMMALGVIEPSQSPYCSPLMLVKKVDGTFRPVIDFRQINRVTVFDAEPMPNPEVIFAKLAHDKVFSTFDFCKGYWQIPMVATDKEKTAFSSSLGLFQFRRMPFGLVNAGATYGRMMRRVLDGLPDVDNYVDDVIVHSPTWKSHLGTLRALFARVRQASLTSPGRFCWSSGGVGFDANTVRQS